MNYCSFQMLEYYILHRNVKNLIYRLRKIFQNQGQCDLIMFKNGGYGINKEYCIIKLDIDSFDLANTFLSQDSFTQDEKR